MHIIRLQRITTPLSSDLAMAPIIKLVGTARKPSVFYYIRTSRDLSLPRKIHLKTVRNNHALKYKFYFYVTFQ